MSKKTTAKAKKPKASAHKGAENKDTKPPETDQQKGKKAAKKKWPEIRERIFVQYKFNDGEVATLGRDMARIDAEIELLDMDAKNVANDFKSKKEVKTATRTALSQKIHSGEETREATAIVVFDTKRRVKKYVELHDRKNVLKEEPMTEHDWQLPMFKPAEVVSKPPKKANEKPAGGTEGKTSVAVVLDAAIAEAASVFGKVALQIDDELSGGVHHEALIAKFRKAAKKAGWKAKIIAVVADYATEKAENGITDVADALRPYCLDKNAVE